MPDMTEPRRGPHPEPPGEPDPEPSNGMLLCGGNATIYVTDMDRAVRFYTETLGLGLAFRAGDAWARIDAGMGLTLGLHAAPRGVTSPGTRGSITVGFDVARP